MGGPLIVHFRRHASGAWGVVIPASVAEYVHVGSEVDVAKRDGSIASVRLGRCLDADQYDRWSGESYALYAVERPRARVRYVPHRYATLRYA